MLFFAVVLILCTQCKGSHLSCGSAVAFICLRVALPLEHMMQESLGIFITIFKKVIPWLPRVAGRPNHPFNRMRVELCHRCSNQGSKVQLSVTRVHQNFLYLDWRIRYTKFVLIAYEESRWNRLTKNS